MMTIKTDKKETVTPFISRYLTLRAHPTADNGLHAETLLVIESWTHFTAAIFLTALRVTYPAVCIPL